MSAPLELVVQATPNPNAIKLTLNRTVAAQGTTYRDASTADAAWAKELLAIEGIVQVFAINNFVSITKQPQADWETIGPSAERILRQAFA